MYFLLWFRRLSLPKSSLWQCAMLSGNYWEKNWIQQYSNITQENKQLKIKASPSLWLYHSSSLSEPIVSILCCVHRIQHNPYAASLFSVKDIGFPVRSITSLQTILVTGTTFVFSMKIIFFFFFCMSLIFITPLWWLNTVRTKIHKVVLTFPKVKLTD